MTWVCKKCGQRFESYEKPLEHGVLVGNLIDGFKHEKCKGKVVHKSKPFYSVSEAQETQNHE